AILPSSGLQLLIVRPRASFGSRPVDHLVGILDVAGLAMDTVGGVDLQAPATLPVIDHLVHAGGTGFLAGVAELGRATIRAHARIEDLQVRGLAFIMCGGGEEYGRQAVARRERALDILALGLRRIEMLEARKVRDLVLQRPGSVPSGHDLERGVGEAE